MSHMSDLLTKWSHQTVTIAHATTAWDENGMPVTSTGVNYTALVQYTNRAVISSQGKSEVSSCQILFSHDSTIGIDDVITLPDGTSPIILSIEKTVDFDGNLEYVKVYT
jgi:hypothetical protein